MSTQSQGSRMPPLKGYRRRKAMLDLNVPPTESRDQEGASSQNVPQAAQASHPPIPPNTIDVEAIDDDVIESSPRAFAEAKSNAQRNNARRNHTQRTCGNADVVVVDSGRTTRSTYNNPNKRRRVTSNQTVIDCEHYVNLEGSSSSMRNHVPPPPPPPKEPTFNCPICMGPFVEETSTKCGHIFCKACIKAAISVQSKCPTCRKKVIVRDLIRVFLPATS